MTWRGQRPALAVPTTCTRKTNPFYTAGWVRPCLQDESGRTKRPCDWPTHTCNASGSRADCVVSRRLPGQSRASLREDHFNVMGAFFGYAFTAPRFSRHPLLLALSAVPLPCCSLSNSLVPFQPSFPASLNGLCVFSYFSYSGVYLSLSPSLSIFLFIAIPIVAISRFIERSDDRS